MDLQLYHVEIGRVSVTSNSGATVGTLDIMMYNVLDASVTNMNMIYIGDLIRVYRKGGALQLLNVVEDIIVSLQRGIYETMGIGFNGEIGFSTLVDLGLIDKDTAVYLIATYMGIEQAVEEIEELEELGEREKVEETLREIASKLQEIIHILGYLEIPKSHYRSDYLYYTTEYKSTGITYMIQVRGSLR